MKEKGVAMFMTKESGEASKGYVDLIPVNGKMDAFKKFIIDYMKNKVFDQCIIEKSGKTE